MKKYPVSIWPIIFLSAVFWFLTAGYAAAAPGEGADSLGAAGSQSAAADTAHETSQAEKAATGDDSSLFHWIEKRPALIGLIGAIIGAVATLIGVFLALQTKKKARKFARAAREGEIEAEREGRETLRSQTEEMAKAAKKGEIVAEREEGPILQEQAKERAKAAKLGEKEAEREQEAALQFQDADETERRYLRGVEKEHGTINLYGFQSTANLKVRTLEVFVSLRLSEEQRREMDPELWEEQKSAASPENSRHLSPEAVLQRAVRKKRLLLIIGDPGSGKTTLLKFYAVCCLDPEGRQRLNLKQPLLPILAPLSKVDPRQPFCEALSAWGSGKNWRVSAELFDRWLEKRGALVMLDGLDEISDLRLRKQVCEWIDNACDYYPNSQFVVTSRYAGYRVAEGIELHTDHLRAEVLDLSREQQEIFLKNWFSAAYREKMESPDPARAEPPENPAEQAQEVADAVLRYLDREENASLRQMAGAPVLLQIMAILWREFGNLPPSRADLYERCTDYLLYRRDFTRDIPVLLPADQAKIVLGPLCLWMQETLRSDTAPARQLEQKMAPLLEEVKPGLKPKDFIQNLCDRAGILHRSGDDGYIFRHKSFREFLAAGQLALDIHNRPGRAAVLVENFAEGWWRETLLFALGLPKPVIFSDFMERFLPHPHNGAGFPTLLEDIIKEARQKPVAPFEKFLLESGEQDWQKRYNALQCLRLIASEPAKKLVKQVWEREKDPRVKQKAETMLIDWKLRRPAAERGEALRGAAGLPQGWRNPLELDAEYLLISGGKYHFSVTKKEVEVPPLYFAKYPLTNKLYRRFIAYLAEDKSMAEALEALPRQQFAASLLKKAKEVQGLPEYLGKNPKEWADKLRSRFDDDKRFNGEDQPVVGVTWFAATAYCIWLTNLQLAIGNSQLAIANSQFLYRLPTEQEWEWAAGGGKREYPWGNEQPDERRANYGQKVGQTTAVGAYPAGATPEGLMDMAGNVWEWCENLYSEDSRARALRGGSWSSHVVYLRCVARNDDRPVGLWSIVGFRVVLCQS
ncbi:MAG: SUMF1/EgtB/PvdO family nonheme iron enzyme [Calditrichaceae bacterium]|nr:SUMF1/EgtB/PvdO family nonheme iron enzyme [Calditrichia bacterium]NUQ43028.1 SUMF1/EgtB/PvdO family nonheme iron enzyme [Calditrichaceae bacterium]